MRIADEFFNAVNSSLAGDEQLVVLHSSLPYVRPPTTDILQWELMHALRRLVDRGLTVALPTFTFSFCSGKPYHYRTSPSETGVLGQWALNLVGFRRTPHPIYSFAVAGPLAPELMALPNTTTFGDDSFFAYCETINARIVMVGCGWEYCTQFHRYEETCQVPYRYYKDFRGQGDLGDGLGERALVAPMFVRDLNLNPVNEWSSLIAGIRQAPGWKQSALWSGRIESVSCADMSSCAKQFLENDPWSFVKDSQAKKLAWRNSKEAASQAPFKCAILGNGNLANVEKSFRETLAPLVPDKKVVTYTVPFGQLEAQIVDADAALKNFDADLTIFADRIEDLMGRPQWYSADANLLSDRVAQYAHAIANYRRSARGWIVVHSLFDASPTVDFSQDRPAILRALNETLREPLRNLENIHILDLASIAAQASVQVFDARLWGLGRFPFAPAFDQVVAARWSGLALDALGRSARLIALDLDNTLWGGVLGEDGKAGLKLGGDYPGNAFLAFQQTLQRLSQQGFALAVVSKSDEAHALDAMATLPAMLLRPDKIAGYRINWFPKPQNLLELCRELSLGIGSVLFIDDNAVERERMRAELPEVRVLDLPDDPAEYVRALSNCPHISRLTLTQEDMQRVATYNARAKIEMDRSRATDMEAFYASLEMTLHITPLNDSNRSRVQQLLSKTNQFNTTTRRYDSRDLSRMIQNGADVLSLGLEDKYLLREEIGVLVLDWSQESNAVRIDDYLLSCRVLGRGLETAILSWVAVYARRRGAASITGEIIETERNSPVRSVFRDAGFQRDQSNGEWRYDIPKPAPQFPKWLTVSEHLTEDPALSKIEVPTEAPLAK